MNAHFCILCGCKNCTTVKPPVMDTLLGGHLHLANIFLGPIECNGLNIVVVTKKPPTCRIMRLSFYCMNGSIEGRCTNYKNSSVCNSDLIARSVLLEIFKAMCLPSIGPFM